MADPKHINCKNCNYNLIGIDLAGVCPECGHHILDKCFWCDYDLANTAPDDNCPECGVPANHSIGDGILATIPDALLKSIYTGFKLASILIPVSILWLMVIGFIAGVFLINLDSSSFNFWLTILMLGSKLLILAMVIGWWKLAAPIPGLPDAINGTPQRKLLNIALITFASIMVISVPISFIPTNPDSATTREIISSLKLTIFIVVLVNLVILYFAQLWYMQWFTKLTKNQMMHKRAKYMLWLGPVIAVAGFMFFFIGPLMVLALYWELLARTRKDLKAIRQHTQSIA